MRKLEAKCKWSSFAHLYKDEGDTRRAGCINWLREPNAIGQFAAISSRGEVSWGQTSDDLGPRRGSHGGGAGKELAQSTKGEWSVTAYRRT